MEPFAFIIAVIIAFALGMLVENRLHANLIRRDIREQKAYKEGLNVIADYAAHDVQLTTELYNNVPPEHFRHEPPMFDFIKIRHLALTQSAADNLQASVQELEKSLVESDITNGELFLSNYILAMDVVDTAALGGWICQRAKAMSIELVCMLIPEFNGQRIVWYPGNINEADDLDIPNN